MLDVLTPWMTPAVIVTGFIFTWRALRNVRVEVRQDVSQLEMRLREDMKQLDGRVARLEHGQAKLDGLLEGLRGAITRRSVA